MRDKDKTKEQLITELMQLSQRITELKASESELQWTAQILKESEERYNLLITNIPGVVWTSNQQGETIFISSNVENVYGYTPEEIYKKGAILWFDRIHPEDIDKVKQAFNTLFRKGKKYDVEYRIKRKDGQWIWLHDKAQICRKKDTVTYAYGVFLDITERKLAEEKIKHLNLVLSAVRHVNQLIIKESNRDRLIKDACNILIENCSYHNAWIALFDESRKYATSAEAGLGKDFFPLLRLLKRGELTNCARIALTQSEVLVVKNPLSSCTDCPLANEYAGRGAMTISLEHKGKVYGLLSASIPIDFVEDEEEQSLFKEVAADIASALYSIELEEKRKKAEENLKESEQRFKAIFDKATDGILLADIEKKKFHSGNEIIFQMLGYSLEEIKNLAVMDIHPKQDLPYVIEQFEKQSRNEITLARDIPVKRKDGSVFYADINSSPIKLGEKTYLLGIFRDITERKRAEEEIRKTRDYLENLINYANAPIIVWNPKYKIIRFNHAFERLTGKSISEVLGMPLDIIFPNDKREDTMSYLRSIIAGRRLEAEEIDILCANGEVKAVLWNSAAIYAPDGTTVIATIAQGQDITERKRAEEEIRKKSDELKERIKELNCLYEVSRILTRIDLTMEETFQRIISFIPLSWQYPQITHARIIFEGLEFKRDKFKATKWKLTSDIIVSRKKVGAIEVHYQGKKPEIYEEPFLKEERRLIDAIAREIGRYIEHVQADAKLREYTDTLEEMVEQRTRELKEAQDKLIKSEKMALLGQVAAGVGHELRNPLGIISNSAYYLESVIGKDHPKLKRHFDIINRQIESSNQTISNFINFTQPIELIFSPVNIPLLMKVVLNSLDLVNIEIVNKFTPKLPQPEADKVQLMQVMINLIRNSTKAMPEGGKLTIDAKESQGKLMIKFSDTGVGISPENLPHIFEPFFTTRAKGIGLGLALCKRIMEKHGGSIEATSKLSKGTTFTLLLPLKNTKHKK